VAEYNGLIKGHQRV